MQTNAANILVPEALREAAFKERRKIHDIVMEGIRGALKNSARMGIDDFPFLGF